jgi:hypothetical protein
MRVADRTAAVVLLLISGYVMWVTGSYPAQEMTLGPAFFPRLVSGILAALAVGIFAAAAVGRRQEAPVKPPRASLHRTLACLGLYVALLPHAGFIFATPVFLCVSGFVQGEDLRKWWKAVVVSSVATTAALYYVFVVLLSVPLP